ncbi:hypothetical protein EH223_15445 [candidate division KSB1 bacterium]|nr:hypothetical protein [candidate division KSB1 bacterium]RQW01310.1 MAG: hypothetical protein EH223_15445 [candidate division KSB1 bacterium]
MCKRRSFFASIFAILFCPCLMISADGHEFNGPYEETHLSRIAFPLGGLGAGMICLEGTGALSHFSMRHEPDIFNEPFTFAAISIKGGTARVLEGPVPAWKIFGAPNTGNGAGGTSYGLPRCERASFYPRFPFATIKLADADIPLDMEVTGWSPFIPTDADNSSLPVAVLEYTFTNKTNAAIAATFSFSAKNFMRIELPSEWGGRFESGDEIKSFDNGYILHQNAPEDKPHYAGDCAVFVDDVNAIIDHCWFRGGWFDSVTMTWKAIENGGTRERPPCEGASPGASIYVPFQLTSHATKTIRLFFAWYVPQSSIRAGSPPQVDEKSCQSDAACCPQTYMPWYARRFKDVKDVATYWRMNCDDLKKKSELFRDAFYAMTAPPEVLEAVAANLTILKSPTVMRQHDGRLWAWEGCHDLGGCCYGSCTHVWNYAQAIPHLFPSLERTLRETEFTVSQNEIGHQTFRANLPISPPEHNFHAAVDGQLGGIMKAYREWRIFGDKDWLSQLYPKIKSSMNYCVNTWDPQHKGIIEEPHHNTYDIEFWGPDGMCTSFYLGALTAISKMGAALGDDVQEYEKLLAKGIKFLQAELFNGDYFIQKITTEGLVAKDPIELAKNSWTVDYSPEALELLKLEGPKYQYGNGCISDGVLGFWIAHMCGLGDIIDPQKVQHHLLSVYKYNLKHDLSDHVNPQRPAFATGAEGGLLLCTWPHGDQPSLPFVYSNEVWTGIEYQVASHLILEGFVEEGLDIVRTCRKRYDGQIRNPFNEYECGHWYARALASYGLIQAFSGARYDAVDKILFIRRQKGTDFTSFLSTATGFGTVGMKNDTPFINPVYGYIDVNEIVCLD